MIERDMRDVSGLISLAIALVFLTALPASAQRSVGSGPLTESLTDIEPEVGVLNVGRVKLSPGLVIREIGWDDNIFNDAQDPKRDFVASVAPDVSVFSRLRFVQLSAYGSADFTYYQQYDQERSITSAGQARADFLVSRVRPFVAAARHALRSRPNGEIDVRADRVEQEVSGGLAFEVSPYSLVYASAYRFKTEFADSFEEGINLGAALNRERTDYQGGVRLEVTPLSKLTLFASYGKDTFVSAPQRDGESYAANAALNIGRDALIQGVASIAYKDFKPVDPLVERFRGITGRASITMPVGDFGRVGLQGIRDTQYSFDASSAYYLENSLFASYTQLFGGGLDAQVKGGWSSFNYEFSRGGIAPHRDRFNLVSGSVGYNLPNRTRVSINYEFSRRRSPALPERNYERRRAFLAWTLAF